MRAARVFANVCVNVHTHACVCLIINEVIEIYT